MRLSTRLLPLIPHLCFKTQFCPLICQRKYKWTRVRARFWKPASFRRTLNISADANSYVTRIAKYFTKRFRATTAVTSGPDTAMASEIQKRRSISLSDRAAVAKCMHKYACLHMHLRFHVRFGFFRLYLGTLNISFLAGSVSESPLFCNTNAGQYGALMIFPLSVGW